MSMTFLVIAVERYLAVCHPIAYQTYVMESWNKRQCAFLIVLILVPLSLLVVVKIYRIVQHGMGMVVSCFHEMERIQKGDGFGMEKISTFGAE